MNNPKHIDPRLDPTRTIRAPRGAEKTCKTWIAEAAYRMIQNNLDPEVAEHPHALVVYGGIGRAARNWDCFDQILDVAEGPERRRDAADSIGQAGRRVQDACGRTARAAGEFESGAALGDVGTLPRTRSQGPDDVRPDDRGQLDLHRQPGHRAGHLRDVLLGGEPAFQRRSVGPLDSDGRPGRHGRRATAGSNDGRLLDDRGGMRRDAHRLPSEDALRRQESEDARRSARHARRSEASRQAGVDRPARQRSGRVR